RAADERWQVATGEVVIAPGATVSLTFELTGTIDPDGDPRRYTLVTRPQPIVDDEVQTIRVTDVDGRVLIEESGPASEPRTFTPE
ncbi:MAG: hypothetical protein ABWZ99_18480, partial [Ilumatobacteraceae bacterium]